MVARLRHIALSVSDPDKAAKFFEDAFGMKRVGKAGIGCYVSDGTINVALLKYETGEVPGFPNNYLGLVHFGMWVDNLDEAEARRRPTRARPILAARRRTIRTRSMRSNTRTRTASFLTRHITAGMAP